MRPCRRAGEASGGAPGSVMITSERDIPAGAEAELLGDGSPLASLRSSLFVQKAEKKSGLEVEGAFLLVD
jgi:hypothetical protein